MLLLIFWIGDMRCLFHVGVVDRLGADAGSFGGDLRTKCLLAVADTIVMDDNVRRCGGCPLAEATRGVSIKGNDIVNA